MDGVCGLTVDDGPMAHQARQETENTSFSKHENGNMLSFQSHLPFFQPVSTAFKNLQTVDFQTDPKSQC